MEKSKESRRKEKEGTVVSDKMTNTVVVRVDKTYRHPRYNKVITRGKKYYAHDPSNTKKVGDQVKIKETRPLSKLKRWVVVENSTR